MPSVTFQEEVCLQINWREAFECRQPVQSWVVISTICATLPSAPVGRIWTQGALPAVPLVAPLLTL
jgi:hypothetical protein